MKTFKQILIESTTKPLVLWRGCSEDWECGLTRSPGETGEGVYAMVPSPSMAREYTKYDETLIQIKISPSAKVVDFTKDSWLLKSLIEYINKQVDKTASQYKHFIKPKINTTNYQRYGHHIEAYLRDFQPGTDVFIVNHQGPGIPKGKQAVIVNEDVIIDTRKIK